MRNTGKRERQQKGIIIPLTGVLLLLLIPVVGLAIDGAVLYLLKAKLSASTDAAAMAAARSLNVGLTLADQEAAAKARALAFFNANCKPGSFSTTGQTVTATVAESSYRTRTVTVTASFNAPQYFMRYLGYKSIKVAASGKASRRDVNILLILDRSGSMKDASGNGNPCTTMKSAATNFTNMFAEGRDRLGLITFGGSWYLNFAPSMTFKTGANSLVNKISQIQCSGATATGTALYEGYKQLQSINEPGALNLLVLFTDGYANTFTADFPVKKLSDTRYGYTDGYKSYRASSKLYDGSVVCNSEGATCTMEPSPCTDSNGNKYDRNNGQTQRMFNSPAWNPSWTPPATFRGALTQAAGDTYNLTTGGTWGLIQHQASSATDVSDPKITAAGCAFTSNFPGYNNGNGGKEINVRRDVAYIPDADIYGLSTEGYKDVAKYNGGSYDGKKRVDVPMAVTGAGMNVADNAAAQIRNDASLKPVIYTIGLGSNGGVDQTLLRRMANDPTSPVYNDQKPIGLYVYAPSTTDLNLAFVRVASEILRIAQ